MPAIFEMSDGDVCYGNAVVARVNTLRVAPGEVVLIDGPNGSGKSSLFMSIIGLGARFTGSISYHNRDITHLPTHSRLAAGIAFVPQGRRTFPRLLVSQHLELSRYWLRDGHDDMEALGSELGSKRGNELSGGEAKIVLTRSLLGQGRQLLIMDEPLASLDGRRSEMMMEIIRSFAFKGVSCLLSDHTGLIVSQLNARCVRLVPRDYSGSESRFVLEGKNAE